MKSKKNWHSQHTESLSFGSRLSDSVASNMGSWRFIIIQTVIVGIWMVLNVIAYISHWDPYPFILLNLALSFQAAYSAPDIMMSQNEAKRAQAMALQTAGEINQKEASQRLVVLAACGFMDGVWQIFVVALLVGNF